MILLVPLRNFLTSADVVKELRVPKTNLFAWEAAGKIPKARRDLMSGYRIYTPQDVERIRKIITKGLK